MNENLLDGNLLWIVIGAIVLVLIIVVVVIVSRGKSKERNRERASELRTRAAQDEPLISTRQDRTVELEHEAEAARQKAMSESARAEELRSQAGAADELAARAADDAEILEGEATHSRESLDEALEDHEETLREADKRDPDVHTDRHGNRIESTESVHDSEPEPTLDSPSEPVVREDVLVIPDAERLDIGDDYSGDEFGEPDAEYIDPVDHERLEQMDDVVVADPQPEAAGVSEHNPSDTPADPAENDGVGESDDFILDDNPRPETTELAHDAKPDGDYLDPVEHDRLARMDEIALEEESGSDYADPAGDNVTDEALLSDETLPGSSNADNDAVAETDYTATAAAGDAWDDNDQTAVDEDRTAAALGGTSEDSGNDWTAEGSDHASTPAPADPWDDADAISTATEDPSNHAEESAAPALDPYGNPVSADDTFSAGSTALTDDTPRNEMGQILDPYGNPVLEPQDEATPTQSPAAFNDEEHAFEADDDLPRDEQGRLLDPYGNPVPGNLQ